MFDDDELVNSAPVLMHTGEVVDSIKYLQEELDYDYADEFDGEKIATNVGKLTYGMKEMVKNEHAQASVLSSMKANGWGKSTLGYWMGKKIMRDDFSFDKHFFFRGGQKEIDERSNELKIGEFLFMDELIRMWYKRRAMTSRNIDFVEWLAADQRKTGIILAGAIPDMWDIDTYIRNGRLDHYVEILTRGIAMHFVASRFPGSDPWHQDELERLQKRRVRGRIETIQDKARLLKKHPCFKQMLFWTRMPDFDKREYLAAVKRSNLAVQAQEKNGTTEEMSNLVRLEYERPMVRTSQAVVNLVNFLRIRGLVLNGILKEAGINGHEYSAMEKIAKTSRLEPIIKIHKRIPDNYIERPKKETIEKQKTIPLGE